MFRAENRLFIMPKQSSQVSPRFRISIQISCNEQTSALPPPSTTSRSKIKKHLKKNLLMLLAIPGCILSPLCLNMYITDAQLSAARTANGNWAGGMGFGFAWGEVSGGRG